MTKLSNLSIVLAMIVSATLTSTIFIICQANNPIELKIQWLDQQDFNLEIKSSNRQ